jgi:hypothetical protein
MRVGQVVRGGGLPCAHSIICTREARHACARRPVSDALLGLRCGARRAAGERTDRGPCLRGSVERYDARCGLAHRGVGQALGQPHHRTRRQVAWMRVARSQTCGWCVVTDSAPQETRAACLHGAPAWCTLWASSTKLAPRGVRAHPRAARRAVPGAERTGDRDGNDPTRSRSRPRPARAVHQPRAERGGVHTPRAG